jgi:hypothetical protein
MLQHLKTKESGVSDVVSEYKSKGMSHVQDLGAKHLRDQKKLAEQHKTDCGKTMEVCEQASLELAPLYGKLASLKLRRKRAATGTDRLRDFLADA